MDTVQISTGMEPRSDKGKSIHPTSIRDSERLSLTGMAKRVSVDRCDVAIWLAVVLAMLHTTIEDVVAAAVALLMLPHGRLGINVSVSFHTF